MDEQLADELSEIFARCRKDEKGEVEVNTIVGVFIEKYGDQENLREYMLDKLDPNRLNEPISEQKLLAIMKNIINQEDEYCDNVQCPTESIPPPSYCSTPKLVKNKVTRLFKDLSNELSISAINESYSQSSSMSSAIQKSIVASTKVKIQELTDRLIRTEMMASSFESRLKNESATNQAIKKENMRLKEELKQLRCVEELKLEERSKMEELEKRYEKKCQDLARMAKQMAALEERLSDLQNENKDATQKLKLSKKTINEQATTIQSLTAELAQARRDLEHVEREHERQATRMVSFELERQTLVDRISQVSEEKHNLAMKLAEMSACQTIPCLNCSDDASFEAILPSFTETSGQWNKFNSLQQELELKQFSLTCHSTDSSCDNHHSSHREEQSVEAAVQTSFSPPVLRDVNTQTKCDTTDSCEQFVPLSVETATQTSLLPRPTDDVDTQTEFDANNGPEERPITEAAVQTYFSPPVLRDVDTQTECDTSDRCGKCLADTSEVFTSGIQTDTSLLNGSDPVEDSLDIAEDPDTTEADATAYVTTFDLSRFEDSSVFCCCASEFDATRWATPDGSPTSIIQSVKKNAGAPDMSDLDVSMISPYSNARIQPEFCLLRRTRPSGSECSSGLDTPSRSGGRAKAVVVSAVVSALCLLVVAVLNGLPWPLGGPSCSSTCSALSNWIRLDIPWNLMTVRYNRPPPM